MKTTLRICALLTAPVWACSQALATDVETITAGSLVEIFAASKVKGKLKLGSGTGFVINDAGYIGTNNHVIDDAVKIYANLDGQSVNKVDAYSKGNAELIWRSESLDLAIIKVEPSPKLRGLTFTKQIPRKGEAVIAIGYPGAADGRDFEGKERVSNATFTKGVLSRTFEGKWKKTPLDMVQHSAEVSWGNSGGPLVDECSRVIGINTQISLKGKAFRQTKRGVETIIAQAPGVYFASHISELMEELDNRGIRYDFSDEVCLPTETVLRETQQRFQSILMTTVVVGGLGFLALGTLVVMLMRKPRAQVVHALNVVSRRLGGRPPAETQRDARAEAAAPLSGNRPPNLILDGLDPGSGERFRVIVDSELLAAGEVLLGRESPGSQIVIKHNEVSRVHLALRWTGDALEVKDMQSTNGTFVNGERVSTSRPSSIRNGDQLRLGNLDLRVVGNR